LADLQRWFTYISGHPSAAGRAQDRESLPVKDQRSTTAMQPTVAKIRCCQSDIMTSQQWMHTAWMKMDDSY